MNKVYIQDKLGNRVLPITHVSAVFDNNGDNVSTLMSSLKAEVIGTNADTASSNTINGAKKYADSVVPTVMGASGSGHKGGLVPDPGSTAGTTKYLREDGTWTIPPDSTTPESIGFGYGTCSTASGTAAKTVSVTDFTLTTNGIVSVRFQEGIGVNSSTLNVNETGAKPIMLGGVALPAGTIGVNTTVVLQYDGTNWNIVGSPINTEYEYVDLDLPSGNLWATMNVGATSVTDAGLYFQWGDIQGYTAEQVGVDKTFDWANYKYSDSGEGTDADMTKYNSTDGKTVPDATDDAAVANMGSSWRMPTESDYNEILDTANCTSTWVTDYNDKGINGRLFTSIRNGNTLFFPAAGFAGDGSISLTEGHCYCWSSSLNTSMVNNSKGLSLASGYANVANFARYFGLSVRGITNKKHINYRDVTYETTSTADNSLTAGAIQLNGSIPLQTISITGAVTSVSFASGKLPPVGHSCHVIFSASSATTISLAHVTTGAVRYICPGGTNPDDIEIPAGGYAEIDFLRAADTIESNSTVSWIYVRGI